MKKHMLLLTLLLITSLMSTGQMLSLDTNLNSNDSMTFSLEETRILMKINEDRKTYKKLAAENDSLISICSDRLDLCNDKVIAYEGKEVSYKNTIYIKNEQFVSKEEELKAEEKKTRKANAKFIFTAIGGAVLEVLTLYALFTK